MKAPAPSTDVMRDRTVRRILAFFAVISAVLVAIAVVSVRNIQRSAASSDWVNHTHAVILEVNDVLSAVRVGDAAVLTYVVTGDPQSRVAGREAFSDVDEHLAAAKALTRNEPAQHEEVARLDTLAAKRIEFSGELLAARQSGQPDAVRVLLASDAGEEALADLQRTAENLTNEEMNLLADRDRTSFLQAQMTRWTVWSGVVVNLILLGGVVWLISDDIAARRRAAAVLQEANDVLEARVRERTASLTAANQQLVIENLERSWLGQSQEHQIRYNQLIIDSISDLVFVLTKALNISRINPAVVHLTGFESQDLIHQPLSRVARLLAEPRAAAPLVNPIARALVEGRDLRDQPAEVEDRNGKATPARLSVYPLRDRDKVVGGVVILRTGGPNL